MKFYDRKKEMAILYAAKKQSQTSACFTVMTGRRRIGKTALLLESVKDTRFVYIFVARKSEVLLCAQYQPVIQETLGIRIYGEIREFAQLFELLMQHSQKENFTSLTNFKNFSISIRLSSMTYNVFGTNITRLPKSISLYAVPFIQ